MVNFTPSDTGLVKSDCMFQLDPYDRPINTNECEQFSEAITFYHNVLDSQMCDHIIRLCYVKGRWQKAITAGEAIGQIDAENSPRQNDICHITSNKDLVDLDRYIHRVLSTTLSDYLKRLGIEGPSDAGLTQDEGYSMLRYKNGGHYKKHIDYSSYSRPNQNPIIRAVTSLIYLNSNYEGGEVYFNRQDIKIKPTAGGIIFFPSIYTHPHTSMDIISGSKYCIVTWWK
jgi:hypothetical protein